MSKLHLHVQHEATGIVEKGCANTMGEIRTAEIRSENDASDVYRIYDGDSYEAASVHTKTTCCVLNGIKNLSPTSHRQNKGGLHNFCYG